MNKRLPALLLAFAALLPLVASVALAQQRAEDTWYLRPRVGLTWYQGDNDQELDFSKGDLFNDVLLPWHLAFEVGYKFSKNYSLGVALVSATAGNTNDHPGDEEYRRNEEDDFIKLQLIARHYYRAGKRVSPFAQAG